MSSFRLASVLLLLSCVGACKSEVTGELPVTPMGDGASSEGEPLPAAPVLSGQLLGHDGSPLAAGHLSLTRINMRGAVHEGELGADGRFRVELPGPGVYTLRLAGVDHAEKFSTFWVEGGEVSVTGQLGTYARKLEPEKVRLRLQYLDAQGEDVGGTELDAAPVEGQVYAAKLEPPEGAVTLLYQIVDPSGRSFNGPGASAWSYDGGGDFWAERPVEGLEQLELDLAALAPSGLEAVMEFEGEGLIHARLDEARALLQPYQGQVYALFSSANSAEDEQEQEEVDEEQQRAALCEGLAPIAAEARSEVEALEDEQLRVYAALSWGEAFMQFAHSECFTAEDLAWALELAPAEHEAWAFMGMGVERVFGGLLGEDAVQDFLVRLNSAHREPGLRAHLLYLQLRTGSLHGADEAVMRELWTQLETAYPESYSTAWGRQSFDPDRPLQVGKAMPEWSFADLEGQTIGSEQLRGQAYFIDVWATWCGPCVGEMPEIHAAYEATRAAPEPIVFVSISMDDTTGVVHSFREEQFPMPWHHVVVPEDEHQALYEAWAFSGIPLPILVDAQGNIVALNSELRGEQLLPALEGISGAP